jgi:hypothetical protein
MTRQAVGVWLAIAAVCVGSEAPPRSAPPRTERDFFPIMPWEMQAEKQAMLDEPGHGIESLRACGFNTVAFVRPDQLEKVEKAGMRALVGRPADLRLNWRSMSDRAIVEHVNGLVEAAGKSDALIGYFLADEPSAADFPALGRAVAAVKRLAPGKLAYINLYPNYATLGAPNLSQLGTKTYTEYLERYVKEVKPQFISYDNYSVQYSLDLTDRARAASYFTNLLEVRRVAAKHGLPFWNVVGSNQIRPYTTAPSPANLRVQAYTTLAAGARGLTWFTYYAGRYQHAPIDTTRKRTATWTYLKAVNSQVKTLTPILTRLRSTGVSFTAPAPASGLPLLPGRLVRSIASPTPVMVGEFSGGKGEKYALVVNLSLKRSASLTVIARAKTIERISPIDRSPIPPALDGSLRLAAGQGALLRLRGP